MLSQWGVTMPRDWNTRVLGGYISFSHTVKLTSLPYPFYLTPWVCVHSCSAFWPPSLRKTQLQGPISPSFGLFCFQTGIAYLVPEALGTAENYILLRWMHQLRIHLHPKTVQKVANQSWLEKLQAFVNKYYWLLWSKVQGTPITSSIQAFWCRCCGNANTSPPLTSATKNILFIFYLYQKLTGEWFPRMHCIS